ncbi:MAG TPA: cache domain-containing protein, partial [Pirellulales bacterium]
LADLVDRCWSVHPSKRFANPQMVIDALQVRVARRARRPLLILGALGPMLLLTVMILFFWSGAETSVKDFEAAQVERSLDSNRFAARFVAELVGEQIDRRWATLSDEGLDPQLRAQLTSATGKPVSDPARVTLQTMVDQLRHEHPELTATHWFLLDRHGNQLAASPLDARTAGKNFAFRDYFNGSGHDLSAHPADATPIHEPHRSHVYRDINERLALAFTVPVWSGRDGIDDQRVIGVLGISVELGNFAVLRPETAQGKDRFASLVDTLADGSQKPQAGLILEHASTGEARQEEGPYPQIYVEDGELQRLLKLEDLVLKAEDKRSAEITQLEAQDDYHDPFGGKYAGRWLAAFQPVLVHYPHPYPQREINTHWVVVVQERFDDAVHPVRLLGHRLLGWGLEGLGVVLAVVTALWLFVILVMNETPLFRWGRRLRQRAGLPVPTAGSSSAGSSTGTGTPGSLAAIAADSDSGMSGSA